MYESRVVIFSLAEDTESQNQFAVHVKQVHTRNTANVQPFQSQTFSTLKNI